MGIPTPPDDYEYGLDCGCWSAGHTPKNIYVAFAGITMGDLWLPAYGSPPNGIYSFPQRTACSWHDGVIPYRSGYATYAPGSSVRIAGGIAYAFFASVGQNCVFAFANESVCPDHIFCGGIAIVFQLEPGSSAPSLADIMELINMQGRESRKAEVFPLDNSHLVTMFADQVESTRIRIKYKFT